MSCRATATVDSCHANGYLEGTIKKGLYVAGTLDTLTKQKNIGEHFHVHPRFLPDLEMIETLPY
jgi:hypothetical protein